MVNRMSFQGTVQRKTFFIFVKRRNWMVGSIMSSVMVFMGSGYSATAPEKHDDEK